MEELEKMMGHVLVPTPGLRPGTVLFINPAKLIEYREGKISLETLCKACCMIVGLEPSKLEMRSYLDT